VIIRHADTGHCDIYAPVSSAAAGQPSDRADSSGDDAAEALRRVAGREWYHTIDLAPGVETPGFFDLRTVAPEVLPADLTGKRCLDVAAFDGFWTLAMLERGAREVVAIDVLDPREWDWPFGSAEATKETIGARKAQGEGFEIVMEALGRDVERRDMSVYDLDPADIGTFDFVYVGSLLLHLRDPVRALERVRSVCSGELVLVDNVDPVLTKLHPRRAVATFDGRGRPWWWKANLAAVVRMLESAGFDLVGSPKRIKLPRGAGQHVPALSLGTLRTPEGRVALRNAHLGDPHVALRARPRG
jgi:tRNA (mo5U34)-methyltransferase